MAFDAYNSNVPPAMNSAKFFAGAAPITNQIAGKYGLSISGQQNAGKTGPANAAQLHAEGDRMTNMANQIRLGGGNAAPQMARATLFHQMAMAKSNFSPPDLQISSPIHERVTPHLIHTDIHTGIRSPGVSGINPANPPQQGNNASDIVGGGAQSALSSL